MSVALSPARLAACMHIPGLPPSNLAVPPLALPMVAGAEGARSLARDTVFAAVLIAAITLGRGRATIMHGGVHLVLFAVFLFHTVVP